MAPWKRTYLVVWIANAVTAVGMMSFLPFFPSFLEEELGVVGEDRIALWAGLVFGAAPLVAAVSSPLWGSVGDRLGRKIMVLRAMAAISLFVGGMAFVRTPVELLLLRMLQGAFSGFIPPSITLVSVQAPDDRQGSIAGSLQSALATGAIVGPLLGAAVRDAFGNRAVFLVVSVLALTSCVLVLLLAREEDGTRPVRSERVRPLELLRGSLRDLAGLMGRPGLRAAVLLSFVVTFGVGATNPLLELFVRDLWTGDSERVGYLTAALFTILSATTLVAMPLWGRLGDRIGHRVALLWCAAGTGVGLVLHALVPTYLLLWPARVFLGGAASGAGPCTFGVAAEETPREKRGGAFGAVFAARALATSTSAMVGGVLCGWLGIRGLFAGVAAGVLVFLVLYGRRMAARATVPVIHNP